MRIDELIGRHLALTLIYPSLGQQFKNLVEEVRTLRHGPKALAGHKLRNRDGKETWSDRRGASVYLRYKNLDACIAALDAQKPGAGTADAPC